MPADSSRYASACSLPDDWISTMKTPDFPANEKERLETLRSVDILNTDAEERFDRLTRMARRVFGVSIALVSLVDVYNAHARRGYDIEFSDGIVSIKPDQNCTVDDLLREADVLMCEKKLDELPRMDLAKKA